jgi:hypothetical protein
MSYFDLQMINRLLQVALSNLETFDEMFNIIPFIWLTLNFAFASVNATALAMTSKYADKYTAVLLTENMAVGVVIVFLCSKTKAIKKEIGFLRQKVSSSLFVNPSNTSIFAMNSIDRSLDSISSFKMTALSLFLLDGSLIFSYLGSLLTFTVLFVQFTQED